MAKVTVSFTFVEVDGMPPLKTQVVPVTFVHVDVKSIEPPSHVLVIFELADPLTGKSVK